MSSVSGRHAQREGSNSLIYSNNKQKLVRKQIKHKAILFRADNMARFSKGENKTMNDIKEKTLNTPHKQKLQSALPLPELNTGNTTSYHDVTH